jgi:DNA-directed RNA polymerase subunit RPC12/RpoP
MDSENTLDDEEITLLNEFECSDCGEELKLIHLKGKYVAVSDAAVPALFGAGGYSLGGSVGLTALGGGIAASLPLAAVGAFVGGTAVYVAGETKESLECPECDSNVEIQQTE